jgi:hypothetical protein
MKNGSDKARRPEPVLMGVAATSMLAFFAAPSAHANVAEQSFEERCAALANYDMRRTTRDVDSVKIQSALVRAPASPTDRPLHCAVTFTFDVKEGDPMNWFGTSTYFLPPVWNGRFVHTGGGGPSSGWDGLATAALLVEGTAHAEMNNDSQQRRLLWLNPDLYDEADSVFSRDGVHLSTVLGKQLISEFYGKPARNSYYTGCSTGGNQGIQLALYHPKTFDGISAGAAAFYPQEVAHWPLWQKQLQSGLLTTRETTDRIAKVIMERCDAIDGTKDGVIDWPEQCKPDLRVVATEAGLSGIEYGFLKDFLSDKLIRGYNPKKKRFVNLVRPGQSPVINRVGSASITNIYGPAWMGTVDHALPSSSYGNFAAFQQSFLAYNFASPTFTNHLAEYYDTSHGGHYSRDLEDLRKAGTKFIVWSTTTDESNNHRHSLDWVEFQKERAHGNTDRYLRFYQKTTGLHCVADATVLRLALYDWVEKGRAPESLKLDPGSERPSCDHPKMPKFDAAKNAWSCVVPKVKGEKKQSWSEKWGIRSVVDSRGDRHGHDDDHHGHSHGKGERCD